MSRGRAASGAGWVRPAGSTLAVVALFAALTLAMTFPLWLRPASTMLSYGADADLVLWILSWNAHAFLHQPFALFDANIYYPHRDTLAFAENLIGTAFFSAPVQWITGSPVLALNAVSLLSCLLCGIGAWALGRRIGLGTAGAIIAGIVFAFSPPRFLRISQIHLTTVHWIPFGLATLHAYLDRGRPRDLKLTALFFTLQALSSGHGAVFMMVACGGLLLYRVALGEPLRFWRRVRDLGVTGLLLLLPVVLIAIPYRRVRAEMGFVRQLRDWGIPPTSFLASPSHVHAWLAAQVPDARILQTAAAYLFPGVLVLLLAAVALLARPAGLPDGGGPRPAAGEPAISGRWWRGLQVRHRTNATAFYGLLTLVTVLLSIGPPLGIWPLVFGLPGFDSIRVPSRFTILGVLGLAMLAGIGLERLCALLRPAHRRAAAVIAGALLMAEFLVAPLRVIPYQLNVSAIDRWVATQSAPSVVAEVPVVDSADALRAEGRQAIFMLHSTAHWQKTVHGYSGFRSPAHAELYEHLLRFPTEEGLRALADFGVTRIIVHASAYDPADWREVEGRIGQCAQWLTLEHTEGIDRSYALRRPEGR
jgi:hypothetical protein